MKLYFNIFKMIIDKFVKHKSNGETIKIFAEKMGLAYIKFAQMLAMQNYGTLFTEEDRKDLEDICDNINPLPFSEIKTILEKKYGNLDEIFSQIDEHPIGSASISQVHKATLKNGEVVAIKVKRKDITKTLESDIANLRDLINKYIYFLQKHKRIRNFIDKRFEIFNLNNLIGFNKAFQLYYGWILEETDFHNEVQNIKKYGEFAASVNGKIPGTKKIVLPKVYENLSSNNVIVMEYISYPTIKNLPHTEENNDKISQALNSYLQLSFYALFHGYDVIFHGDPHGGNVYLDDDGNVGFLDMGLTFQLSQEECDYVKKFFFSAYTENPSKLYQLLLPYSVLNNEEQIKLKKELETFCMNIKNKNITSYFTDMINIIIKYNVAPPNFLFRMAKAFVCLSGIDLLYKNQALGFDLLLEQTLEYIIEDSLKQANNMAIKCLKLSPKLFDSTLKYGLVKGIIRENEDIKSCSSDIREFLENASNFLRILQINFEDKPPRR